MTNVDDISQKLDAHIARQVAICYERAKSAREDRERHDEAIRKMRDDLDKIRNELGQMRTVSAVQAVKIGIWAGLGASIPTLALGIVFLLSR